MMAKLVWKPFASDGQKVEDVEMEGGSSSVQKLGLKRDLVVGGL